MQLYRSTTHHVVLGVLGNEQGVQLGNEDDVVGGGDAIQGALVISVSCRQEEGGGGIQKACLTEHS